MTKEAYDKIAEGLDEALSGVKDDKPVSALPEKFEVFEERLIGALADGKSLHSGGLIGGMGTVFGKVIPDAEEKPKRRRSTPAVKPKDMPEAAAKPVEKGGRPKMVESSWNGRQMWRCPECGDTTFKPHVVNIHVCARPREAKV